MKHLRRVIVIAAGAIAVAYSTAIATPAVTNLLERHTLAASYVGAAVAVIGAVYASVVEKRAVGDSSQAPASTGSQTMGAK